MSRLAASLGINTPPPVSRYNAPDAALRRLELPGTDRRGFVDLIQLSGTALQQAVREIDLEGQRMEAAHLRGVAAVEALKTAEEKLTEIRTLQQANARSGSAPLTRRDNQKKIDALLKEIHQTFAEAGTEHTRVFDGTVVLSARNQTIELPELSLDRLGRVAFNGRMRSLADLASRGAFDTTRRSTATTAAATRSIDSALDAVSTLREKIETFTRDTVRPRLGDVAEVLAGLYETLGVEQLATAAQAQTVLKDLRDLTLQTSAVAVAVGADNWDRQRVMDLLS